ncbi:MAG: DUF4157 domain-containing protein [Iphinoe sp. HA4291-MV1]|jgi:hypothetical protein|nr:DUF4157 domain-containing protein [Iphinoe sp. HA4291-MV1]
MGEVKQETFAKSKSHHLQQARLQETESLAQQSTASAQSKQIMSRIGNTPSPKAHADILNRAPVHSRHVLLQLQRQYGNRYVQQVVQQARQTERSKIQAKLSLGAVGDRYEQEADRVAKKVVSNISSASQQPVQRMEPEEEEKAQMKPDIQRMATSDATTVDSSIEDGIQQARGSGVPLANNIREPMEQAFGADFSGVKVHTGAQSNQLNQSIQARAFTTGQDVFFRQGEYNPGSQEGQELIAHELTHVVQQNGTGVQRSQYLLGDELIREQPGSSTTSAQAKTRTKKDIAQGRADYAVLQRYTTILPSAPNYPTKRKKKFDTLRSKDVQNDESFFVRQEEYNTGGWTNQEGEVNLIYNGRVPLRISQNSDLAIEDTPEAKIFFATVEKVQEANKLLHGSVLLSKGREYLALTSGKTKKLYKVEPIVKQQKQEGLEVTTPQACDQMAQFVSGNRGVTGSSAINEANKKAIALLDKVAPQREPTYSAEYQNKFLNASKANRVQDDIDAYTNFMDLVAGEIEQLGRSRANDQAIGIAIQELNINQLMNPRIGSAITTVSLATPQQVQAAQGQGRDLFEYHWGTVVAKDGGDYITMENYVRRDAGTTLSSGDPLFFFKMYGTAVGTQTWHMAQIGTGSFLNPVLSIEMR